MTTQEIPGSGKDLAITTVVHPSDLAIADLVNLTKDGEGNPEAIAISAPIAAQYMLPMLVGTTGKPGFLAEKDTQRARYILQHVDSIGALYESTMAIIKKDPFTFVSRFNRRDDLNELQLPSFLQLSEEIHTAFHDNVATWIKDAQELNTKRSEARVAVADNLKLKKEQNQTVPEITIALLIVKDIAQQYKHNESMLLAAQDLLGIVYDSTHAHNSPNTLPGVTITTDEQESLTRLGQSLGHSIRSVQVVNGTRPDDKWLADIRNPAKYSEDAASNRYGKKTANTMTVEEIELTGLDKLVLWQSALESGSDASSAKAKKRASNLERDIRKGIAQVIYRCPDLIEEVILRYRAYFPIKNGKVSMDAFMELTRISLDKYPFDTPAEERDFDNGGLNR